MDAQAALNLPSDLLEVDWELLGRRNRKVRSTYHWYPEHGRHEVAGILIGCLSERGALVLDPCCGIGTTLIEAKRQGRQPVGGDVNPVASLVTNARLLIKDRDQWDEYVAHLRERVASRLVADALVSRTRNNETPNLNENQFWYHAQTLDELLALWAAICDVDSPYTVAAEAAFSATLRFVSSQHGPLNRIADNIRPPNLKYHPVAGAFFSRLNDYFSATSKQEAEGGCPPSNEAWTGSAPTALAALPDAMVDLVVTHLPGPGTVDYVRSHRLTSLWFGWPVDEYASAEIGARYKRRRATVVRDYYEGIDGIFAQVARVLKPGRWCAFILGSALHRARMTVELSEMLSRRDFEFVGRLGGRNRGGGLTVHSDVPREDIIVARRKT